MILPFTQYLLPNGRKKYIEIRINEYTKEAQELLDKGYKFEIEILRTGELHMDCSKGDNVLALKICPNDHNSQKVVEELVRDSWKKL